MGAKRGERLRPDLLRIEFPDRQLPDSFREISWAEFFEAFDRARLAFLYKDEVEDAVESRFYKFVKGDAGD
jgi:hypothetical protein